MLLFSFIRRSENMHVWKGPHDRDIFSRVMAHAERSIGKTAAYADDFNIGVIVADVVADLLVAAEGWEIADGIDDGNQAHRSHAASHRHHILFGDAGINILLRQRVDKRLKNAETEIAGDDVDIFINACALEQNFDKCGSHFFTS